jgi:hypothetical protein
LRVYKPRQGNHALIKYPGKFIKQGMEENKRNYGRKKFAKRFAY